MVLHFLSIYCLTEVRAYTKSIHTRGVDPRTDEQAQDVCDDTRFGEQLQKYQWRTVAVWTQKASAHDCQGTKKDRKLFQHTLFDQIPRPLGGGVQTPRNRAPEKVDHPNVLATKTFWSTYVLGRQV